MRQQVKVLCVHGIGRHEERPGWFEPWRELVTTAIREHAPQCAVEAVPLLYAEEFRETGVSAAEVGRALGELLASWAWHGLLDLIPRPRGLEQLGDELRWTAGMVAQWVADGALRPRLRRLFLEAVTQHQPDVILAHSLGSLIAYEALSLAGEGDAAARGRHLITFGSQVGHPAVRKRLGGRLRLPALQRWHHLFNPEDRAFTRSFSVPGAAYEEVRTPFTADAPIHHGMEHYLRHPAARNSAWREAAGAPEPAGARVFAVAAERLRPPDRRALLVGINEYEDPASTLEGCVNDAYRVSATLQECGFAPEQIRVVLNRRATAAALRERLAWLLEDVREGDERVFYFSGHGARMAAYGATGEADHTDECLAPTDFDWTPERAVLDDQLYDAYSQLPYGALFVAVLDCCHSGGMARGGTRPRGLEPPDDVRHRLLRWDAEAGMWCERTPAGAARTLARTKRGQAFVGSDGAGHRLFRAVPLRLTASAPYDAERAARGHHGPYLPTILQACGEDELAYEYRDGATCYGAFTFALTSTLRRRRDQGRNPTFGELVAEVRELLRRLGYAQTPALLAPGPVEAAQVPWVAPAREGEPAPTAPLP